MTQSEIRARDHERCSRCGSARDLHVHHRIRRSQGGTSDPPNLITLCSTCHSWVHSNPLAARKLGLLLQRHADPATIPVDHFLWPAGPVLLDGELGFVFWHDGNHPRHPGRPQELRMRIVVYHTGYGCESGCCGHAFETGQDDGSVQEGRGFQFVHPYGEDHRAFAEDLVREEFGPEHVADLDWENCLISED